MAHTFENRVACMDVIRTLCADDPWRLRYALLAALGHLDLEGVNVVRRAVEGLPGPEGGQLDARLQLLLRERWG